MLNLCFKGYTEEISEGLSILENRLGVCLSEDGILVDVKKQENGLSVVLSKEGNFIGYSKTSEFFRALSIVVSKLKRGVSQFSLTEESRFDTCGAMIDVSRNAVLTVSSVKDLIERMALMGLNMLMLYTEDTYEMEKYPWFGYMRGAYTKGELKEIDRYGLIFGVELIPCIQTLAHLATTLRWPYASAMKDQPNILLADEPKTYEFIDEMLRVNSECFTSCRIHIGLDEAGGIGLGRYLKLHGLERPYDIITRHIGKVVELAEKYGYRPMMWSDMFFRLGEFQGDYNINAVVPADVSTKIPENIGMVYWDYCYEDEKITDTILTNHKIIDREIIFAGGIWTWDRIVTSLDKSFDTARTQLSACKNHGVKTVFVTIWGNGSNSYNIYSALPGLQMYAEQNYHESVSDEHLSQMFNICTGYKLADFKLLSVDDFSKEDKEKYMDPNVCFCINSSVQHFYNDPLTGLMDKTLSGYDFKSHYQRYLDGISKVDKAGDMQELFELHKLIYEILVVKCDIGTRITEAYRDGDKDRLGACVADLEYLHKKYNEYHIMAGDMWHKTHKPFGYDAFDMRHGGVEARIFWAIRRLREYLDGKVERLEELEVERFYYNEMKSPLTETVTLSRFVSASVL